MNLQEELDESERLRETMCRLESGGGGGHAAEELAGKCRGRDPTADIEAIIFGEKFLVELAKFRGKITASDFPFTD